MKLKEMVHGAKCGVLSALVAVAGAFAYADDAAEGVAYLDWDDAEKKLTNAVCTVFETYTVQTTLDAGKTYVVTGDVTNETRITVNGTVESPTRLILCDGAKLTAQGGVKVTVSGATTNALVICGQVNGTGALEATGGLRTAGIGGLSNDTEGESGMGGTVTINGGTVTATGGFCAAGIGGGWGGHGGTVTINGGTVTAKGGNSGAGIGGGLYGAGGNVSINGGTVTATAGTDDEEAPTVAIGCCQESGDNGTVTFGAGKWIVKQGDVAPGTNTTAEAYAADHSAKYVHIGPAVVAQFVKGGEVVAKFVTAEAAVAALDDAQYADIDEFRIGLAADTVFDFGGRTNRVVILNVGDVENTLKNVLLDCAGDYVVTGMVGTVVFGEGVRIEKETGFKQGLVELIIKGGLYKSDPSRYCEGGYCGARRCDANAALNGLYDILPEAEIAVTVSKGVVPTHYATLQDAFNLIGEYEDVTLRLFNNLELGTAVMKLEGNKVIHLLPSESGANTIKRVGPEPVIEIGLSAKLEIKNVVFDGANVTSEKPMIKVAGKTAGKFGWLIAGDGFVVSNAVGGAVHVGSGGKFELDGVAKIIDNTTDGKPKNVIIEDSKAIQLTDCGAVTDGNYAQIGVWSETAKFMVAGGQFGTVNTSYEYATDFADGDISVAKPWVGFINDLDGSLHHAAGAKIADAGKNTYKRWVGGKYKELVEEGDHLRSREKSIVSSSPELIWTARQEAPAAEPAPAVLDWTDTTLTLAVSNGCDYALVTSGSAKTNWVSMVGTDNTYEFARPAGDDYLCLRRYSITTSNIVSAATAYSVRVAAGTEGDRWLVGAENPEDVTAWTNGNEFVVSGDGTVSDLSKLASKVTVEKLTIKDATVTVAEDGAFTGFSNVSLTLPDGWQGELPDEDGNWYGATVTLTAMPLTVKNVTFLQRYPWNGLVDITCDLSGAGKVTLNVTVLTNGVAFCEAMTLVGKTTIDLGTPGCATNGVRLVWDAAADLPAGFKVGDISIEMAVEKVLPVEMAVEKVLPGQLWKGGPIWAECNVGATKPTDYGILTNFNDAAQAVTDALGNGWRLPTKAEFEALLANCGKGTWTEQNGAKGRLFTGTGDYSSNSIFLPAAGYDDGAGRKWAEYYGRYWSSGEVDGNLAWYLNFYDCDAPLYNYDRSWGFSVRAVRNAPAAPSAPAISAKSAAGTVDLTVGDRVAKDEETLVVDPAWDETDPTWAEVRIDGEDEPRTYTCASNDLWQTASLEPGRYEAELKTACSSCVAGFWKTGDDWTVFDSSNITADVTFEAGKTYLFFGTNTADGVRLKVEDGAKFAYDMGAPSGFRGEEPAELPKRYMTVVEGDLYQIVEKAKGCADNPWEIGEGVTAYTNGNELVIGGEGAMKDFSDAKPAPWGASVTSVTLGEGVTGIGAGAFKGCDSITKVTTDAVVPPTAADTPVFGSSALTAGILVPADAGEAYRTATGWSDYKELVKEVPGCAERPWTLGEGVTAWVDEALTNLAAVVIDNGLPTSTNAISLTALTNAFDRGGYEPAKRPLNALLKIDEMDKATYVKPVSWFDANNLSAEPYETLAAALDAGVTAVVPNFEKGAEIPQEIVETEQGEDGKTYLGIVENVATNEVDNPIKVLAAEGLTSMATNEQKNARLVVEPKDKSDVELDVVQKLTNTLFKAEDDVDVKSANFVDLSVFYDNVKTNALESTIAIHIPWKVRDYATNRVARCHEGSPVQEIPEGEGKKNTDGEYFEKGEDEVILHVKNFSYYALGESYVLPGSPRNPWPLGEGVTAVTNGSALVIGGEGTISTFAKADGLAELLSKLTAITITSNGVTDVAANVFQGVGTDDAQVSLALPDGWQGELPDKDGNWYGTKVNLMGIPLAVKRVTFLQRYPWNGKVDVGFTLTGPAGETNVVVTVKDGETEVATFPTAVTIPADGVLATNLVWDAATAGLAANFKSDDVTVEVAITGGGVDPTAPVQLWKNGPYFATCNVGANTPEEYGYYFWWGDTVGYTNNGATASADKKWVSVADGTTTIQFSDESPANTLYGKDAAALADYVDANRNLKSDYDAAKVKLGDLWRMMTKVELDALTNTAYCTAVWTDNWNNTSVKGYVVSGNTLGYTDKSIFLPATGFGNGANITNPGANGCYWSSTPDLDNSSSALRLQYALNISFISSAFKASGLARFRGGVVRAVRDTPPEVAPAPVAPAISAKSAVGTVDLRTAVVLAEGATTVAGVNYSDTAWGEATKENVTLGYTNETTGATGTLGTGLVGAGAVAVTLPQKDGDYLLTHSTGDLTSFVKFTVSGYPLGSEGNPWEIGAGDDPASVTAVSNGVRTVFFKPVRGVVTKAGLETITNAMGGASFPAKLISADGTATNDVVMLLGDNGVAYDTLAELLAADPLPETVRLFEVKGYWVTYDRGGNDGKGEPQPDGTDAIPDMDTDMFIPTVPTNLTANAYVRTNFVFDCWLGWTNGVMVTHLDGAKGVDFCEPGATLALTAQWTRVAVPLTVTNLAHTTVTVWTNGVELTTDNVETNEFGDGKSVYLAQTNANVTVVYRAKAGYVLKLPGKSGTVVIEDLTYGENDSVPEGELPTVVEISEVLKPSDIESADGGVVLKHMPETADGIVTLPAMIGGQTLVGIAPNAFKYCVWLKELDCSAATGLKDIGAKAFAWCSVLQKLTLPDYSLTTVSSNAFEQCTRLTKVVLPASLDTVGAYAFSRCYSLTNVEFKGTCPTLVGGADADYSLFYGVNGFALKVPADWTKADVEPFFVGKKTWQKVPEEPDADGVWRCELDPDVVTPTIMSLSVMPEGGTVKVSKPIEGLYYRVDVCTDLASGDWTPGEAHLCTSDEAEAGTLELECVAPPGDEAYFRVTVSEK